MSTRLKLLLLVVLVVGPFLLAAGTAEVSFERAHRTDFCASCHVMSGHIDDLKDPQSESLAAMHYKNRWINDDQCYRCHTDYKFLGPTKAKVRGLQHIAAYYFGGRNKELKLYEPYDFGNCLVCHGEMQGFLNNPIHEEIRADLASGDMTCLDCHGDVHTPKESP